MGIFKMVDLGEESKPYKTSTSPSRNVERIDLQDELSRDFLELMDRWYGHKEIIDDELEAKYYEMLAEILRNPKPLAFGKRGTRYFSPSSANSCKRELYMKMTGAMRDQEEEQPHKGRWKEIGTAFGEMIQKSLLYIEKHYEREFNEPPAYVPEYTTIRGKKYPMWERFAKEIVWIEYRGHKFPVMGQPDGILRHRSGKRVGLEIKSKQTTASQTSAYSLREPKEDHFKQCVLMSIMYGVDDWIVVYGNLSKKSWNMTREEYEKNPDLRAFHIHITERDRIELLDYIADVLDAVKERKAPPLDLEKFNFNNYKGACVRSLTDDEMRELEEQVERAEKSRLPDWKKRSLREALNLIKEIREGSTSEV